MPKDILSFTVKQFDAELQRIYKAFCSCSEHYKDVEHRYETVHRSFNRNYCANELARVCFINRVEFAMLREYLVVFSQYGHVTFKDDS